MKSVCFAEQYGNDVIPFGRPYRASLQRGIGRLEIPGARQRRGTDSDTCTSGLLRALDAAWRIGKDLYGNSYEITVDRQVFVREVRDRCIKMHSVHRAQKRVLIPQRFGFSRAPERKMVDPRTSS